MFEKAIQMFLAMLGTYMQPHTPVNTYSAIHYTIAPEATAETPAIKIEVKLQGTLSKNLVLNLPYKRGRAHYAEQIKNISIQDPTIAFTINTENCHRMSISLPKQTDSITISYEIHQNPKNHTHVNEAIIREDIVHALGHGLFATPTDAKENDKIHFSILWNNLPNSWKTLSSFGTTKLLNFKETVSTLKHAFYAAGKLRLHQIVDQENPVYLSLYGSFDVSDKKIAASVAEIITTQRSFFTDSNFPYYAISLIEGNNPNSMGGTALHKSFTAYVPYGRNYQEFYLLFAHEHFHNWLGGKIANNGANNTDKLHYWWQEGFTDYYARVLALRSGGISMQDFISECNELLNNYYLSPVLNEPNTVIQDSFWKDNHIQNLPYVRGFVFALYLNDLIKRNDSNKSIDSITLDLFAESQHKGFSVESFKTIAKKHIPQGIDKEITEYIDQGKTIDLSKIDLPMERVIVEKKNSYRLSSAPKNQLKIKTFFDAQ
jgi:predicted metalloprotease with PDZ domain